LDKTAIAVGDSAKLEVILSTRSYDRRITKSPKIFTNECPDAVHVTVTTIVAKNPDTTYYPIVINPPSIGMFAPAGGHVDTATFEMTNISNALLNISLIAAPEDLIEVTLPTILGPGETAEGSIKVKPDAITESFEKSITIEVYSEPTTRFTVPIKRVYSPF
jgi:hypothetical protein